MFFVVLLTILKLPKVRIRQKPKSIFMIFDSISDGGF